MTQRVTIPLLAWAIGATGTAVSTAAAVPPDLAGTIPAEAWAALMIAHDRPTGQAAHGGPQGSPLETAAFLLAQARRMGFAADADAGTRVLIDAAASLPAVLRHPWALCLLGTDAEPFGEGGYRLAELRVGLIIQTDGRNADLEACIQHLLHSHVSSQTGRIETVLDGTATSHRLVDNRLPDWAHMQWGAVNQFYVLALGPGAFGQIAATIRGQGRSLPNDAWFQSAHARCHGDTATIEWTLRFDRIRQHLEPIMTGRPDEVIGALGLGDVRRGLWTVGSAARAVEAYAVLQRGDVDEFTPICVVPQDTRIEAAIPPEASRYAAIHYRPRQLVLRARDAYLASRSPSTRANWGDVWARIEAETGVSTDRDLLEQLGQWIVIHNEPPNPLSLPLAETVLVEISGSPVAVRTTLDRLLGWYQRRLASARGPSPGGPGWLEWQLKRDPDGVWYLQAGIYGPALAVTERWIVISYSPVAVRQNLAYLKRSAGQPTSQHPDRQRPTP